MISLNFKPHSSTALLCRKEKKIPFFLLSTHQHSLYSLCFKEVAPLFNARYEASQPLLYLSNPFGEFDTTLTASQGTEASCDSAIDTFIHDLMLVLAKDKMDSSALIPDIQSRVCGLVKGLKEAIVRDSVLQLQSTAEKAVDAYIQKHYPTNTVTDPDRLSYDTLKQSVYKYVVSEIIKSDCIVNSKDLLQLSDRFEKTIDAVKTGIVTAEDIVMMDERVTELSKVVAKTMDLSKDCESSIQTMKKKLKALEYTTEMSTADSSSLANQTLYREVVRRLDTLESELGNKVNATQTSLSILADSAETSKREMAIFSKHMEEKSMVLDGSMQTLRENVDNLWRHHEDDISKIAASQFRTDDLELRLQSLDGNASAPYNLNSGSSQRTKADISIDTCQSWIAMLWQRIGELESEMRNLALRTPTTAAAIAVASSAVSTVSTRAEGSGYETFHTACCSEIGTPKSDGASAYEISRAYSTPRTDITETLEAGFPASFFDTTETGKADVEVENESPLQVKKIVDAHGNTLRLQPSKRFYSQQPAASAGIFTDSEEYHSVGESPAGSSGTDTPPTSNSNFFKNKDCIPKLSKYYSNTQTSKYSTMCNFSSTASIDESDDDEENIEGLRRQNNGSVGFHGMSASVQGVLGLNGKLECLQSTIRRNDGTVRHFEGEQFVRGLSRLPVPREVTNLPVAAHPQQQYYFYNDDNDEGGSNYNNSMATERGSSEYTNNGFANGRYVAGEYFAPAQAQGQSAYGNEKVLGFYRSEFYKDYTSTNPYHGNKRDTKRRRLVRPFFRKHMGIH